MPLCAVGYNIACVRACVQMVTCQTVPKVIRSVLHSNLSFLWSPSLNLLCLGLLVPIVAEIAGLAVDNA